MPCSGGEALARQEEDVSGLFDEAGNIRLPLGDAIVLTTGKLCGLGDHAIYSTLPKRFTDLGYHVYVDQDNKTRNDDIMRLFWIDNPYVLGESTQKPNAGHVRQGLFYELANRYPIGSIEAMERAHGLPPPYSLAPWIAYKPKPFHVPLDQAFLVDFSSISSKINDIGVGDAIKAMQARFKGLQLITLTMPKHAHLHAPGIRAQNIQVDSIYQYCDMLASCRAWVGSEAGGQSLAAAVRGEHDVYELDARPEIIATLTPKTFNSRGYTYRGVDYRVTSQGQDNTGDYFNVVEQRLHEYEVACSASLELMQSRA
jgi:hypothetical protein